MFDILSAFTARGVPVLFSSHQLDLVERLCDHIVILRKGELVASGTVKQLQDSADSHHRILTDSDLGWLRQQSGLDVLDIDGNEATVRFLDGQAEQRILHEALQRGPVRAFGPVVRPLSHIYREVTR